MATIRAMCTCSLILVLILSHEVLVVEGRRLKSHGNKLCKKCSARTDHRILHVAERSQKLLGSENKTSKMDYVDDFRPTFPGHSPGVGHSLKN